MWIFGIIFILISLALAMVYVSNRKKLALMANTETSTVEFLETLSKSMSDGVGDGSLRYFTEVRGKIRCEDPLVSELAETDCVYYSMKVEREYEETYFEEDSEGRREEKTRSARNTVAQNTRSVPFMLEDATGKIKIITEDAEIIAEEVYSRFEPSENMDSDFSRNVWIKADDHYDHESPDRRTIGYHYVEEALETGREVYIIGEASDKDGTLCMVSPTEKNKRFIISSKGEEALMEEGRSAMVWSMVGSLACGLTGVVLIIISIIYR